MRWRWTKNSSSPLDRLHGEDSSAMLFVLSALFRCCVVKGI
jgi:hypothetical protein